jgi:pimeloyl-ACP methyl ester carboxylesterase
MMSRIMVWSMLLTLLTLLASRMPIPTIRADLDVTYPTYITEPNKVYTTYITVSGYSEPHTPQRYNQTFYLRYFTSSTRPKTVVVLMPGLFSGASSLDIVARQLVATASDIEVWVIDRRANTLEDRSAFRASLTSKDPQIAYDYYVVNAGQANGFRVTPADQVHFLGYWGLEVHLRDLHEVIKRAHTKADTVILGGHSLGASLVSFYTSFNVGTEFQPDPG